MPIRVSNNTDRVWFNHSAAPVTTTPFTLFSRFNIVSTPNRPVLAVYNKDVGDHYWVLASDRVFANDGGGNRTAESTVDPANDAWQSSLGVFPSATSRTIYVNGADAVENTVSCSPAGANGVAIGGLNDAVGPAALIGHAAEAAIWNVADLTTEEIAALTKGYSPMLVRPSALVAYWPGIRHVNGGTIPDLLGGFPLSQVDSGSYLDADIDHPPGIIYPVGPISL